SSHSSRASANRSMWWAGRAAVRSRSAQRPGATRRPPSPSGSRARRRTHSDRTGQAGLGQLAAAIEQVGLAAGDGRLVDALHAFPAGICNDDEIAALDGTDFHERWSGGVPELRSFFQQLMTADGPGPDHPEALAQVTVPVLLLTGEQTLLRAVFDDAVR